MVELGAELTWLPSLPPLPLFDAASRSDLAWGNRGPAWSGQWAGPKEEKWNTACGLDCLPWRALTRPDQESTREM